jgi:ADP-ribose pyrophosphatase YjhB (NUDIX family)
LHEETGLKIEPPALGLLDTAFVRHPDGQFVLVVVYTARRSQATGTVTAGSDAAAARFWDLDVLTTGTESIEPGYEEMLRDAVQSIETE